MTLVVKGKPAFVVWMTPGRQPELEAIKQSAIRDGARFRGVEQFHL